MLFFSPQIYPFLFTLTPLISTKLSTNILSFAQAAQSFAHSSQNFAPSERSFAPNEESFARMQQTFTKTEQSFAMSEESFALKEQNSLPRQDKTKAGDIHLTALSYRLKIVIYLLLFFFRCFACFGKILFQIIVDSLCTWQVNRSCLLHIAIIIQRC